MFRSYTGVRVLKAGAPEWKKIRQYAKKVFFFFFQNTIFLNLKVPKGKKAFLQRFSTMKFFRFMFVIIKYVQSKPTLEVKKKRQKLTVFRRYRLIILITLSETVFFFKKSENEWSTFAFCERWKKNNIMMSY